MAEDVLRPVGLQEGCHPNAYRTDADVIKCEHTRCCISCSTKSHRPLWPDTASPVIFGDIAEKFSSCKVFGGYRALAKLRLGGTNAGAELNNGRQDCGCGDELILTWMWWPWCS
jgi:hypothetical protein